MVYSWKTPKHQIFLCSIIFQLRILKNFNNLLNRQDLAAELSNERANLFGGCPNEVIRHLTIIKPMANLLVDGVSLYNFTGICIPGTRGLTSMAYVHAGTVSRA